MSPVAAWKPQWNSAKLKSDLGELLKRVSIAPRVAADAPAGLAEMVAGALAQAGFMLDTSDHPQFVVQASMNLTDLGLKDGWYWQRGTLEITLSETANNRVRGTRHWGIKGNGQNKAAPPGAPWIRPTPSSNRNWAPRSSAWRSHAS